MRYTCGHLLHEEAPVTLLCVGNRVHSLVAFKRWQWDWHFDGSDTWDYTEDFFSPPAGDDGWVINGATSHTYPNPGQYNLRLKVTDDDAYEGLGGDKSATKTYKINVVSVGLSAERGYVGVNDDDDDENGIMDKYDGGTQPAENDLVKILLSVDTPESTDKVKLSVSPSEDYGRIKIWSDADKQSLVIPDNSNYYKMWSAGAGTGGLPTELWVEAISASRINGPPDGPSLTLTYIAMDGQQEKPVPRDPAATITFTFLEVDMDMDGVKDESQFTDEITPGGFIPLHGVVKITLREPLPTLESIIPIDDLRPVVLKVIAGGSKIKVWDNEQKQGTPIALPKYYVNRSQLPDDLWVEGVQVSSSTRDITLTMEYTIAGHTFGDKVNITVLDVDLDIAGVSEEDEESVGEVVVLKFDNNNAPRKEVILMKVEPSDWSGNVILSRSNNTG